MFVTSILKCLSSVYLSLPAELNTGCLRDDPHVLLFFVFLDAACLVPVVGILFPLPSTVSFVVNTVVFLLLLLLV